MFSSFHSNLIVDQDMTSLPNYVPFTEFPGYPLETIFTAASPEALDLLKRMLTYDPNKRITATEVRYIHVLVFYIVCANVILLGS